VAAFSAFGEGAAEAAAEGSAGPGCVAAAEGWGGATTADYAADGVSSPASVVVVVGEKNGIGGAGYGMLVGLAVAEAVVDDVVVFIDATLHLGLAAGEEGQGGGCEQRCGNLGGTLHGLHQSINWQDRVKISEDFRASLRRRMSGRYFCQMTSEHTGNTMKPLKSGPSGIGHIRSFSWKCVHSDLSQAPTTLLSDEPRPAG
jgi:hypothetical protein